METRRKINKQKFYYFKHWNSFEHLTQTWIEFTYKKDRFTYFDWDHAQKWTSRNSFLKIMHFDDSLDRNRLLLNFKIEWQTIEIKNFPSYDAKPERRLTVHSNATHSICTTNVVQKCEQSKIVKKITFELNRWNNTKTKSAQFCSFLNSSQAELFFFIKTEKLYHFINRIKI